MKIYTSWVSVSFALFFIVVPPLLIANAAKATLKEENHVKASSIKRNILVFYVSYFLLVAVVSLSGFFVKNTIPPRIVVATALPLFLFYLFIIQQKQWFKTVMQHIRLEQLVGIHIFRFVGIYFFLVNWYGSLPDTFANIGGTGDILTAALVFPVIYFLKRKAAFAKVLVWGWNILGLVDILLVLTTAIILTKDAVENGTQGVLQFGTFPFSWIPAFAPATIIFLHILIFRKLLEKN